MRELQFILLIDFFWSLVTVGFSQTNISVGNVSGTWTKLNSPYFINGEITISNGETLIIEPGVNVIFKGHYKLNVHGRLLAIGTPQDSIYFTAEDKQAGWHGIRFNYTPNSNDTSKIVFCTLKYGKANTGSGIDRCGGAIMISRFSKVLVSDCLIDSNMTNGPSSTTWGAAIYIEWASPLITNSTFSNNVGTTDGAITCYYTSYAIISHNIFSKNTGRYGSILCGLSEENRPNIYANIFSNNLASTAGGGIFVYSSNAIITDNLIIHNLAGEGGGIKCYIRGNPICINNTIAYNKATWGGGFSCSENCDPILINNIIWGNTAAAGNQVGILDAQSDPHFFFCDIQGGKDGFKGNGAGINYTGIYENNLDNDPLFADAEMDDFHLSDYSPCIGAGTDSVKIGNVWYGITTCDIEGNPRCNLAQICDIGAYENPLTSPLLGINQEIPNPTEFILFQNYPNPFNPVTKIKYTIPAGSPFLRGARGVAVMLKVYDILGNEVAILVDEYRSAGSYEVEFNTSNMASGIYFYQLKAGEFISTKKMILLR